MRIIIEVTKEEYAKVGGRPLSFAEDCLHEALDSIDPVLNENKSVWNPLVELKVKED